MLYFYLGTPRSGKSLHAAKDIITALKRGKTVIGTMYINRDAVASYPGTYIFVNIYKLCPADLMAYARKYNEKGHEGQTLVVIDECHRIFNSRDFNNKDRRAWLDFFCIHGHYGFDFILITQNDRQIDRQIRSLVEYSYIHRKGNNFGTGGKLLSLFVGTFFVQIFLWYPVKEKIGSNLSRYKKKYGQLYDSYMAFDEDGNDDGENELLAYIRPKPLPVAVVCGGGQGDPATDSGGGVTADGYRVDKYGFLVDQPKQSSLLLDNSNNLHSSSEECKELTQGENIKNDL